ncbi:MAG: signal transduction histidine kinase/ligand-binding sensor domain-containing protein [Crocinitomix sp.]|jgi:signal transduction histidine kinase/ligand-binding sensor domain-containing protein/AraC-like DNA-binding protein
MNDFRLRLIIAVFILFFSRSIIAQVIVDPYSAEGLSQNMVSSILEDSEGFIWFGTHDGLNRHDGYNMLTYQNNVLDTTSIIGNYITCLTEDQNGNIWIGTDVGLCYYNRSIDAFVKLPIGNKAQKSVQIGIGYIFEDSRKNIWVATKNQEMVLYYPTANSSPSDYRSKVFQFPVSYGYNGRLHTQTIVESKDNVIWTSAQGRICRATYSGDDIRIENYRKPSPGLEELNNNFVFKDKDDVLWISQESGHFVSELNDTITPILHESINERSNLNYLSYRSVLAASDGKIWFIGLSVSSFIYDPLTKKSQAIYTRQVNEYPIKKSDDLYLNNYSSAIMEDQSGNIWIGHNGLGISMYSPHQFKFDRSQGGEKWEVGSSRAILKTTDGILWFCRSPGKLHFFDSEDNIARPAYFQGKENLEADLIINKMIEDHEDQSIIWATRNNDVLKIKREGKQIVEIKKIPIDQIKVPGLHSKLGSLIDDGSGKIWIAGRYQLWCLKKSDFSIQSYIFMNPEEELSPSVHLNYCPDIYLQNDSLIWLSTTLGLQSFSPNDQTFTRFSPKIGTDQFLKYKIRTIEASHNGKYLWLATVSEGLIRFNTSSYDFKIFDKRSGLVGNSLYAARKDGQGNLWLSSNWGLMRFNMSTHSVISYTQEDGLQDNEFNIYSEHSAYDGELFFGGIKGINRFYPDKIKQNDYEPRTIITEININNKPIDFEGIDAPVYKLEHIELNHDDRIISFTLAGLDYTNAKKNQYAYKLEGFDEDWQNLGTKRTITFTNLDPKTYVLKIKCSNSAGVWSTIESQLTIVVIPPWYGRWWSYSLYLICSIALLYSFYRFQLRRQLEKQEAYRLQELDGVKTKFFTNISHEFRTPLTLIKGLSPLLQNSYNEQNEEKFSKGLTVLNRNSSQLLSLVNQLLDISKIESGKLRLNLETVDLYLFTKHFISAFDSAFKMKDLEIELECTFEQPEIDADVKAITHVIQNLISNALKFTSQGGIKIVIDKNCDNKIVWIISDTGIGIPAEHMNHIFDRFYQVDDESSRVFEGSGIGLALSQELTLILGGEIEVDSELGKGSSFTLTFPLASGNFQKNTIAKPIEIVPESNDTSTVSIEETATEKPTVLIVEDNSDMQYYIAEVLQNDYDIVIAENGKFGYDKAVALVPDFIVSDWMMPIQTGPEMLQQLKKNQATSHIPLMLLTARADQASKLSGYDFGAEAYLTKPFEPDELRLQIKALIEARNALRLYFNRGVKSEHVIPEYNGEEVFMSAVSQAIIARLDDSELNGDWLAEQMALSRSQFARKVKAITGINITQFIREKRLEKAKELLIEGRLNVSEIAFETGFTDPAYFSRIFAKEVGVPPSDFPSDS